jgi:hypothetical protein
MIPSANAWGAYSQREGTGSCEVAELEPLMGVEAGRMLHRAVFPAALLPERRTRERTRPKNLTTRAGIYSRSGVYRSWCICRWWCACNHCSGSIPKIRLAKGLKIKLGL